MLVGARLCRQRAVRRPNVLLVRTYTQMKLADAEVYFKKLVSMNSKDIRGLAGLGAVLVKQQRFEEAQPYLQKVLDMDPDYPEANYFFGQCLEGTKKITEAVPYYGKAVELKPDFYDAINKLAIAKWATGEVPQSMELFYVAIKLRPDHYEAYANLGGVLFSTGQLREAEEKLKKASDLNPNCAGTHFNLGPDIVRLKITIAANIYFTRGRYEDAVVHYRRCTEVNPEDAEATQNLGLTLEKLGRDEEAIEYLDKALLLSPGTIGHDVHLNMGVINEKMKDYDKAIECYLQATKANPAESAAWIYLANLAWKEKKAPEQAKEYLHKALEANTHVAEAHYLLGQIYYLEGKSTESVDSFQRAIELNPIFAEQLKKMRLGEGLPKIEE